MIRYIQIFIFNFEIEKSFNVRSKLTYTSCAEASNTEWRHKTVHVLG